MKESPQVELIPILRDNYVLAFHDGRGAVVVDPGEAAPVRRWLLDRGLDLLTVLHTHHHADHIGGTEELLRHWPGAEVLAARDDRRRIPFQTHGLAGGDRLTLLGRGLRVLAVPGHTRAHLAFLLEGEDGGAGDLFCGDTLFGGGCGRLFEGSAEQMHASLQRLAAMPDPTRVWCAHEYTEKNLVWASRQAPADTAIRDRLARVRADRSACLPTIPSTIGLERRTNLFLRAVDPRAFAQLRRSRDQW
jgi:hydroxyacylglutathione hydrolase